MAAERLFVLVGLPGGLFSVDPLPPLRAAHPRVDVALAESPERFTALLPSADAAIVWPSFAPLLAPALQPGARLQWVQSVSVGVDAVLTPELVAAGHVPVTATKGPMGPALAEHALLLLLALARDLPGYLRHQAARRWYPAKGVRPMVDLSGKTLLILGVGATGSYLARLAKVGLGMRVLGLARTRADHPHVDRYIARHALHWALGEADAVALCLPLTAETRGIIDAAALAAMRPSAFLVNIARGGLVDEAALIEALRAGRLAGAGLDATAAEPLAEASPLWDMPNVIITPHIATYGDRNDVEVIAFWCENLRRFANGQSLLGAVDRQARY
jgi:phosphoglycerate dehydrogenase-like enzyme